MMETILTIAIALAAVLGIFVAGFKVALNVSDAEWSYFMCGGSRPWWIDEELVVEQYLARVKARIEEANE